MNNLIASLEHLRKTVGFGVDMCAEVDFRLTPSEGLVLAKALEPLRLFWLEEVFARKISPGMRSCGGSAPRRSPGEK